MHRGRLPWHCLSHGSIEQWKLVSPRAHRLDLSARLSPPMDLSRQCHHRAGAQGPTGFSGALPLPDR